MSLYAQHCNTLVVTALYHVYPCTVLVTWVSCILHVDLYLMRLQLALSLGVYAQSSFCNYRTLQFTKVMKNQQFLVINTLHCCTSLQTPGRTPRHGFCINTKCNTTQDVAKHTFLISPYIPLVLSSWRGMQHFNYTHNVECMHNTIEKKSTVRIVCSLRSWSMLYWSHFCVAGPYIDYSSITAWATRSKTAVLTPLINQPRGTVINFKPCSITYARLHWNSSRRRSKYVVSEASTAGRSAG